jgi:hypothetical protein
MVAQLVKGLKPKKLKIKQVRLNILNALRAEGKIVKKELEKTTVTWKGAKPTFEIAIGLTGRDAIVLIGPAGNKEGARKWVRLDEGTKKNYPITAKNAPNLVFSDSRGFTPKTKVKTFSSGPGANTGAIISKKQVIHPGIDAREWSTEIVKRRKKRFTKSILKAARV